MVQGRRVQGQIFAGRSAATADHHQRSPFSLEPEADGWRRVRARGRRDFLGADLWLAFALLLLLTTLTACQSRRSVELVSATLARDATADFQPVEPTTRFGVTDEIHLIVQVRDAPPATPIRVVWIAVDVEGAAPETKAAEFTQRVSDDQRTEFTLRNQGPWPSGRYRADIYVNDSLARSLEFEIGERRLENGDVENDR